MRHPPIPGLLAALAALAAASCGRIEGRTSWTEALHAAQAAPSHAPAQTVFPVPTPPFSPGIFPCSRCHEGGEPEKDTRPALPHAFHLTRGLGCADCHDPDDTGAPAIPAREVCDNCHGDPKKWGDGVRAYFAATTPSGGATVFPHRWETHDVRFEHKRHAAAGVDCAACHGATSDAAFAKPRPVTLMRACVSCHEERGKPAACATCHEKTTEKAHANIVLHHAEEQRGCLDCHDAADRDRLRLANGTRIGFEESFRLCGQCHGTQFRDWKVGLHGKRTGSWNGVREYRLCVHCHWPHEPRFKPMAPVAPPHRPEAIR